jgi:hypothetical protein
MSSAILAQSSGSAAVQETGTSRFCQFSWIHCYRGAGFAGFRIQRALPIVQRQRVNSRTPASSRVTQITSGTFSSYKLRESRKGSPRNRLLKGENSIVLGIVRVNEYFPSFSVRATPLRFFSLVYRMECIP